MTSPYYVNDDIPLKFAVLQHGKPLIPASAYLELIDPSGELTHQGGASIESNAVMYVVPKEYVQDPGDYVANFVVVLPGGAERQHIVEFKVNPLPGGNKVSLDVGNEEIGLRVIKDG